MSKIEAKNLLFDLGGVLYSIDLNVMMEALEPLRKVDAPRVEYTKDKQHDLFYQLDRGEVDEEAFAKGIKEAYHLEGPFDKVLEAWNALLIGVIDGREAALQQLSSSYNLALLSNTNEFHQRVFGPQCQGMFQYMQKCFFSYEMGMRKPEHRIFHTVLEDMKWEAEETLFIDDSYSNIEAAEEVGIQTFWMETEAHFEELMNRL